MDVGCNSGSENHSPNASAPPLNSPTATVNSKIGKNKLSRESGQSTSSALNKCKSQIRKPPRRKTSPVNWFPRKKGDTYMNRKIKMLQEVDGINLTLDQTLGSSNPHYSRVLREKMAARDAAHKAMETRRAALVEASWCRILRSARIPSDDAEAQLLKAEKSAEEAFGTAQAMGVIMFDLPNCPRKLCQTETSSVHGEGSYTHGVTASFETAFEVDREVAAAVKTAFIRLAKCTSFSKGEFKELLRKISENPDTGESNQDLTEFCSEYKSESGTEFDSASQKSDFNSQELDSEIPFLGKSRGRRRQSLENRIKLVDMMIERLKCFQEDELSSLATIVATYGLNASLAEVQNAKLHNLDSSTEYSSSSATNFPARRMSSLGLGKLALDVTRKKQVEPEVPSLDKFLVKHVTKLEREVWEAKQTRKTKTEPVRDSSRKSVDETPPENVPDLGSILVKNYSKLEKDIKEAKIKSGKEMPAVSSDMPNRPKDHIEVPSLDMVLVKHVSRLEKEVQEAKNRRINENNSLKKEVYPNTSGELDSTFYSDEALDRKENINSNIGSKSGENKDGLEKIRARPVHRLEREKLHALSLGSRENYKQRMNHEATNVPEYESLDKVLVKHVSILEKEKMRSNLEEEWGQVKRSHRNIHLETNEGGLDQVLVKHKSRLEQEKMVAAQQPETTSVSRSMTRREAKERELQETWGGLSLGNVHLETNEGGLNQVSVKNKSRLEGEKMVAAERSENSVSLSVSRREARERELQEAWGGLSLGNSIKTRVSKLEREKAAWIKAEEEERKQAMKAL
ncbi:hypothetical protein LR48_Vigan02g237900 [Vigna angularis]|uniref:Uncharacterized protein n=2 Tax=Phaseolus angularis TaxID=3914 RepID=A0A0L9U1C5_PHAAN|nr:uncharacterized protein LOC108324281 [Vigna angularis]KOM36229.1 hypothetical protein LR48_Vigan02g237900 [Vigna angularis]BAT93933.1 hypothetical protein VIGAN_08048600 [Vigna angularis var. angularis]